MPTDIRGAILRAIDAFERFPKGTLGRREAKLALARIIDEVNQGGEKSAAIELLEAEVNRLKLREQDLLEANNRYLQRARDAEAKLKELS